MVNNKELTKNIKEWIESNRNNKTRIVFEMQDKKNPNTTYSLTLGNLFDHSFSLGREETLLKVNKIIDELKFKGVQDWKTAEEKRIDNLLEKLKQKINSKVLEKEEKK